MPNPGRGGAQDYGPDLSGSAKSFEDYWDALTERWQAPQPFRLGQDAFNLLHRFRPDLCEKIMGNLEIDPFYVDDRLPEFLAFVKAQWGAA